MHLKLIGSHNNVRCSRQPPSLRKKILYPAFNRLDTKTSSRDAAEDEEDDFDQHSETSEIDIEDRSQSPCFMRPGGIVAPFYGTAGSLQDNRGIINSVSASIRPITSGPGRKPRRRRTAFTHAQLAFLERKFRYEILLI